DRIEEGRLAELGRSIPENAPSGESDTLIVYATAGLLAVWERLEEDMELCFARGYRQIILALSTDRFRVLDFAGHSYLLAVLLNSFPTRKFATRLEVYVALPLLREHGQSSFRAIQAFAENARQ